MESSSMIPAIHGPVKLRSYQKEMVAASLARNVIVAMDTGSGKTMIAAVRIAAELERSEGKLVFFLVPSVALADQQSIALSASLPAYMVRTLTGRDGVDKWSNQATWDAFFTNTHVVVCTPAVLLDALSHGFISMQRLSLCVFDEAHHSVKNHPMNAIMQRFYHPAKQRLGHVPDILGLTASPVINSKKGSLEVIEHNLDAISVTPKDTRTELNSFVNRPELTIVSYSITAKDISEDTLCRALEHEARLYDFSVDPYVLDLLGCRDEKSSKMLEKTMNKRKTFCSEQLRALDLRATSIAEQFGMPTAKWYVNKCILNFEGSVSSNDFVMPDLTEKERKHLYTILGRIRAKDPSPDCATRSRHTDKVSKLISILNSHASHCQSAVVFVEQRVHTTALAHLLRNIPDIDVAYRIGCFVGSSTSDKRKASVADLVGAKEQQSDLAAFRAGEKNLMIATDVLEEGIDISACGLVICFDQPKTLVSFIQRRGRARQTNSKYFLLVSENDRKQNSKRWEMLEAEMKKTYMDDTRRLAEELDDELSLEGRTYQVPSTGALLTLENAKSHLYHFCIVGTTQATNYVDLRPEFNTKQDILTSLWTARVELPSFVHPEVRSATCLDSWSTEHMAVKEAAFQAYVALHEAGLVNDNLLPLVKDYGPDTGQEHFDQPSLVHVSERQPWRAWLDVQHAWTADWSRHTVTIEHGEKVLVTADFLVPSSELFIDPVPLYWNANTTYVAKVQRAPDEHNSLDSSQLAVVRKITQTILRSVHGTRMNSTRDDFIILIAPKVTGLEDWLHTAQGNRPATVLRQIAGPGHNVGLVRLNSQVSQPFFFESLEAVDCSGETSILTKTFPKRKDFLHPVTDDAARAAAYTGKQSLPVNNCTVDNLPAKYALLAAFVPSIFHRIDTTLLALRLQNSLLGAVGINNTSLLLEAVTSPAAGEAMDYNRLEYLGDTVLKHRTELQVISQHPNWPEAYLTVERDRIVRNDNLGSAALKLGLDKFIITKPFTGSKWRPVYISEALAAEPTQREMSTKTLADVMEAVIGATFIDGGFKKAQKCIDTLLPTEVWHELDVSFEAMIQELKPVNFQNRDLLERLIGHKFKHPTLLLEAITHASYSNIQTGLSYERLEFLGDSILDMIVTPKLFAHSRKLKHWDLHRLHEALVNGHFLGYCCMNYTIEDDIFDIVERASGERDICPSTRQVHLHDFLRASYSLTSIRQKHLASFHLTKDEIHHALMTSNEYPWQALVTFSPPKFFSDLVESVLGAIYIDTRGDLSICEAFVAKLGILDYMQRMLDDHVETVSPKERLGVVADRDAVTYINSRNEGDDGKMSFSCAVRVADKDVVTVEGCGSKDEAEVKAAYQACVILRDRVGGVMGKKRKRREASGLREEAEKE